MATTQMPSLAQLRKAARDHYETTSFDEEPSTLPEDPTPVPEDDPEDTGKTRAKKSTDIQL